MWSKKPDILHNGGQVQFIERKYKPSITISPEGSAVMWKKKHVTPVQVCI